MGSGTGHYMDGQSAQIRPVVIHLSDAARPDDSVLIIREGDQIVERWPLTEVREKPDQAKTDDLVVTCKTSPDARLIVSHLPLISEIRGSAPNLKRADVNKSTLKKIFIWAGGAVASVLLIVFVIVPALADQLAVLVPEKSERRLGEASIDQISWVLGKFGEEDLGFCDEPDGLAALDKMVDRLTPEFETEYELSVRVLKHPMENAFAVPGGQVIIFEGLLKAASTPEEIAGVLGHELGHVVHRDPTRLALRSAGTVGILGMLVGDFTGGGLILILTERLISANYAQDAETAADEFAFEVLGDAGLPTAPFGNFFDRMADIVGDDDGMLSHLASHPNLASRADNARKADTFGDGEYEPVLSDDEWDSLQTICETRQVD